MDLSPDQIDWLKRTRSMAGGSDGASNGGGGADPSPNSLAPADPPPAAAQADAGEDPGVGAAAGDPSATSLTSASPPPDPSDTGGDPATGAIPTNTITVPPVRLAPGGDRDFQFNFTQVRTEQGTAPENGNYSVLLTQSGDELGRAQGVPAGVGLRVSTGGFQSSNPVVNISIAGEGSFTRVVFDGTESQLRNHQDAVRRQQIASDRPAEEGIHLPGEPARRDQDHLGQIERNPGLQPGGRRGQQAGHWRGQGRFGHGGGFQLDHPGQQVRTG